MPDQIQTQPQVSQIQVSPTGEPLLPPSVVKWLLPIYGILSTSGLGVMVAFNASDRAIAIAGLIVGLVGGLLGQSSQGWRKVGTMLLVMGLSLSLVACPKPGPRPSPGSIVVDCASAAVQAQLPGVIVDVDRILSGVGVDWAEKLDQLYATLGDVVVCAVQKVVANLMAADSGADPSYQSKYGVPPRTAASRGNQWLSQGKAE